MHIHFFLVTCMLEDQVKKITHRKNKHPTNLNVSAYQKTIVDASGKISHIQYFK